MLLVFLGFVPVATARLGENITQLTRRFGRPLRTETAPNDQVVCVFHIRNGNYDVQVLLLRGVSISETYFSTQPVQPNGEPPPVIVRGIFETNAPHSHWTEQPPRGEHQDSAFISKDGQYGAWISNNGSWYQNGCTFVVSVFRVMNGPTIPPSQLSEATSAPSAAPTPLDPNVRTKLIADYHAKVEQMSQKLVNQPWSKTPIAALSQIPALPSELTAAVQTTRDGSREVRRELGDDAKTLKELEDESCLVDGAAAFSEACEGVHSGNAVRASEAVDTFRQAYASARGEKSKAIWQTVDALHGLFAKLHEEANAHISKAAALADAGKTGNAIEEYQKAFDLFPDPDIAARIKTLREQSLGL